FPGVRSWDRRYPAAAIYFGGPTPGPTAQDDADAASLLSEGVFVLPYVPAILGFSSQVPKALHVINGLAQEAADTSLEAPAGKLLQELRLLRDHRLVFISYKRTESAGVAQQLFRALDAHGWSVFLDTRSVDAGDQFQEVLWERMSDADLVILLDTPTARD